MPSFKQAYTILIHTLLLGALIAIGILLAENNQLRSRIGSRNAAPGLNPGDSIKQFVTSPLQDSLRIDRDTERQLFFFFKTDCPLCQGTVPAWNSIAERMKACRIPVHGIAFDSGESARQYAIAHSLRFPISILRDGRSFALANHMYSVPMTMLVSKGLIIQKIWAGTLDSTQIAAIIREGQL
jgi:peroxiredoxin